MSYSEDIFPSVDGWEDQAYDSIKFWPTHVWPANISVNYTRPALSNYSHNGRKFTRRVSFAKGQVTLEYPPLTDAEFLPFHSMVLVMQGQWNPVFVPYKNTQSQFFTYSTDADAGDYEINIQVNAGQTITRGTRVQTRLRNGGVNFVIADATADGVGVITLKLAYPLEQDISLGAGDYLEPNNVIATLASDGFDYETDETGLYYVQVTFDMDEFK